MKKRFAVCAALSALLAVSALPAVSASAAVPYSPTRPADDSIETTSLTKYLVMDKDASVPVATFTYSLAPGTAISDPAEGKLAVIPGITTGVSGGSGATAPGVRFAPEDSARLESAKLTADSPVFKTPDDTDEKYVTKDAVFDFSGVAFTEPGVYRYIVTEDDGTNQGVTNGFEGTGADALTVRTLDVYVENAFDANNEIITDSDGKPQLKITGYVWYDGTVTTAPSAEENMDAEPPVSGKPEGSTKRPYITNYYDTANLTFAKAVKGNQGSRDKYFKFTLVISNLKEAGTLMNVDITNASNAVPASPNAATRTGYAQKTNPQQLEVDVEKTIPNNGYKVESVTVGTGTDTSTTYTLTAEYYLQHGQYITVQGVPKGASYSLTEDAEDYTSAASITAADSFLNYDGREGNDALSGSMSDTIGDADIYMGFTNTRSGVIPTGVLLTVAGSAGVCAVGLGGALFFWIKSRRRKDDGEE
ncbi:MAG: hypothetical protein IKQ39_03605 [Oscillospiraceae bacterium]|nr:hypothetical protein [Oscillospiraceae bacterium]